MKTLKIFIALIIPVIILLLPTEMIPINNLTIVEHRVIAIFMLAALFWILEPIPIFATSILIITLELLLISDNSLAFLRSGYPLELQGTLLSYKSIMATLASPIIILFLGGFFLAMAASKYQLDRNLARVLLKPFGNNPKKVLLGLMIITAVFSMFMSNTATTAMMLAILAPVLVAFDADDPGRVAFLLGVPFAANIGGIGTPIGTPPNAVAMKYLNGDMAISFGSWMAFALPYVIIMLAFAWFLLLFLYKPKKTSMELDIKNRFMRSPKAMIVYGTFGLTVLLWIFSDLHGINAYVVAMIPIAVFLVSGILTAEDIKKLSWDVLWLIAGGIALGSAMETSGLSAKVVQSIPFENFNPLVMVLLATMLALGMATFMSHTATANLILPVMAALGTNMGSLQLLGGSKMLIIAVTFSCSIAMALPISTPPNAMAYASGHIKNSQMLRSGLIISLAAIMVLYLLLYILKAVDFI